MKIKLTHITFYIILFLSLISCSENPNVEIKLKPLESQIDSSHRYDFIYVIGSKKLDFQTKKLICEYLDTIKIDTSRVWGHEITFIIYKEGMPNSENNFDTKWLGSSRYDSYNLLSIYYSERQDYVNLRKYKSGDIVSEKEESYENIQKIGLGNFIRNFLKE